MNLKIKSVDFDVFITKDNPVFMLSVQYFDVSYVVTNIVISSLSSCQRKLVKAIF